MLTRRVVTRREVVHIDPRCSFAEYGTEGFDTFFGYHDVTPFGPADRLLLAAQRKAGVPGRAAGTPLALGYYDLAEKKTKFTAFATSTAWCWQQGCRLQWYSGDSGGPQVFYNRTEGGRHQSCIFDMNSGRTAAAYDHPLYALSADGQYGVSLNFARLQRLRPGYGYDDIDDPTRAESAPPGDGLRLVNLRNANSELLVTLAQIAAYEPEPSMRGAVHYFNHILWSPDSRRFFFLHLWHTPEGKRRSRAFIWDIVAQSYTSLGPSSHNSHHCWLDNERMIVYSSEAKTGMHYHLYSVSDGCIAVVGKGTLREDGHPSMSPARPTLMVTDTYPDALGEQALMLFDMHSVKLQIVARLFSPNRFRGERRCDLHPRWDLAGGRICVDSAHRGERRLCVIGVAGLVAQDARRQ
jgi:hypothetical protein